MAQIDIVQALEALERDAPCKKRRDHGDPVQNHRWELIPNGNILNIPTDEFRQAKILRCYDCRTWFEPDAVSEVVQHA